MVRCLIVLILSLLAFAPFWSGYSQLPKPAVHMRFDEASRAVRSAGGECTISYIPGLKNKAIQTNGGRCLISIDVLKEMNPAEFALSFWFKGKNFEFISFPKQDFSVTYDYPYFSFTTSCLVNNKKIRSFYKSDLKGAGPYSYDYYNDGNWHWVVFNYSSKRGKREIWADGVLINAGTSSIPPGCPVLFEIFDGFKGNSTIDELQVFTSYLDSNAIKKQFFLNTDKAALTITKPIGLDSSQFAPGFPNYTVSLIDQLKNFPTPRYTIQNTLGRNVSWMDISYLSRQQPKAGNTGLGEVSVFNAVEIEKEMYDRWHYFLDIPLLRRDSASAHRLYKDSTSLPGALVQLAKTEAYRNYSVISIQAQIQPSDAGFEYSKPYILSQNLPPSNYLRNKAGQPIVVNGRKLLSPLMNPEWMERDAVTVQFYLQQLTKHIGRSPSLISENGEVFGTAYREPLLQQDPNIWNDYQRSGLSRNRYFGQFQFKMENLYRSIVLKDQPPATLFSIFQLSGVQADFWAAYQDRRLINRLPNGTVRSTPDFYPHSPADWQKEKGAFNGYETIAKGRALELSLGDQDFSPFVSAGWIDERENIRPAQWLALLKAMLMLGADFFYVGYFNVTGPNGKWPNGIGPNDPRGYAYQIATPAYAQALRSIVPDFFSKGSLLNPNSFFRFNASSPNDLVLVRKWKDEFLIYGSIQPNSNYANNVPDKRTTTIQLEKKSIRFPISRQGSVYVLKGLHSPNPVFYQLDAWHQAEHPFYWSSNLSIEAELLNTVEGTARLETKTTGYLDFSSFSSYRLLKQGSWLRYGFTGLHKEKFRRMYLILNDTSPGSVVINWKLANKSGQLKISSGKSLVIDLEQYRQISGAATDFLELSLLQGEIKLDKILLEK